MNRLHSELLAVVHLLNQGDNAADDASLMMVMGERPPGFGMSLEDAVREEFPIYAAVVDNLVESIPELPSPTDIMWAGAALAGLLDQSEQEVDEDEYSAPMG